MLNCYIAEARDTIPIELVLVNDYSSWLAKQTAITKNWLTTTQYKPEPGAAQNIPDANGKPEKIICCVADFANLWSIGHLPLLLPEGAYRLVVADDYLRQFAIAWGLGAYQFSRYKKPKRISAQLYLPKNLQAVQNIVSAIFEVRDLINTPTDDMGPTQFAMAAKKLSQTYDAKLSQIVGEDLITQNYPAIYTVGRASDDAPRLIDLRWGNEKHPKVTLVGKGVCFDSGGLDIKPSAYMLLMKKDMAGGAHVLGLAQMIMEAKLPICLRVLIPVVENVISGNAYRPGDIIKSRKGLTIEIGNTDAEGRVILADALTEAVAEKPALLIDITTLTGAARVALGTDLPVVFSNHEKLVADVIAHGDKQFDPIWRLPLYAPYREYLNSYIADINNNSSEPYAGAITAGLFLKEFVPDEIPWLHFDLMAWNLRSRPGRPQGGEAMGLRALFSYLEEKFHVRS